MGAWSHTRTVMSPVGAKDQRATVGSADDLAETLDSLDAKTTPAPPVVADGAGGVCLIRLDVATCPLRADR